MKKAPRKPSTKTGIDGLTPEYRILTRAIHALARMRNAHAALDNAVLAKALLFAMRRIKANRALYDVLFDQLWAKHYMRPTVQTRKTRRRSERVAARCA